MELPTDYGLSEEHVMIRDTVRKLATDEAEKGVLDRDATAAFPSDLVESMREIGLFGLIAPEDVGGAGLDTLSYALAVEELAKADATLAILLASHVSLALAPLLRFASDAQRDAWAPRLAAGEILGGLALPGPLSGEPSETTVRARREGNAFVLDGGPLQIAGAARCGLMLVPALGDDAPASGAKPGALSIFLVAPDARGVSLGDARLLLGCRGADVRPVAFDGARIAASDLLGGEGGGERVVSFAMDGVRIALGAMSVGLAQAAFDKSVPYAKERTAFDRPIVEFEAIAHRIAEMATDVHAARLLVYHAARRRDASATADIRVDASMAKLFAAEAAARATDHAIQVLGGYGYAREYHVERYYRDARFPMVAASTVEEQRSRICAVLTAV